jgi:hypothetical protein
MLRVCRTSAGLPVATQLGKDQNAWQDIFVQERQQYCLALGTRRKDAISGYQGVSDVMLLLPGLLCSFMGMMFLIGCFLRVDAPAVITRASGDEVKIANLRSLHASWNKFGRFNQFLCSSPAFLILGFGLLLVWFDASFARFYLAVPVLYTLNLLSLLRLRKHAAMVLSSGSHGDSQVVTIIKQNIRMCVSFGIVYVVLVRMA